MFFYSTITERSGGSVRRQIGIIGDLPMINQVQIYRRRKVEGPLHVSVNGKITLCGRRTNEMLLRLSDPIEWFGRNDTCQQCKRIYRSQS